MSKHVATKGMFIIKGLRCRSRNCQTIPLSYFVAFPVLVHSRIPDTLVSPHLFSDYKLVPEDIRISGKSSKHDAENMLTHGLR